LLFNLALLLRERWRYVLQLLITLMIPFVPIREIGNICYLSPHGFFFPVSYYCFWAFRIFFGYSPGSSAFSFG
jgi:hypothetical protein